MQIRHQLREGDAKRRVQYSQRLLGKPQAFMSQVIIWDEAIFQLNRNVSNHNFVRYAPRGDLPEEDFVYDKPSSGEKLIVWIGLVRSNHIGSYFVDGNVNGQAYFEMLNNFALPQVETSLVWTKMNLYLEPIGSRMEPQDIVWKRSMIV